MKWTFQSKGNLSSEYQMISEEGHTINFKYSRTQQSIRMRFNEHHGVYVLDEGSFESRKFSIKNVYGSEIGVVTKGAWRETIGSIHLDELSGKTTYQVNVDDASLEITNSKTSTISFPGDHPDENYMLALIVFSWMESVSAGEIARMY